MKQILIYRCCLTFLLVAISADAQNPELWGTTYSGGGSNGIGTIFKIKADGSGFVDSYIFNTPHPGDWPGYGPLCLANNGKLYGTTTYGGSYDGGVLFSYDISTSTYFKLFDFNGADGIGAMGNVIQAANGKLYGMTLQGGINNLGVFYSYDLSTSIYTKLFDFDGTSNGMGSTGLLMQATNGKIYGMTMFGGINNDGILFDYDPSTSTFTKLLDFDGATHGALPYGSLMQANNGLLYGMTFRGGSNDLGVLFNYDPVTSAYSKVIDFSGTADGAHPCGSLIQANNGKLYGMTSLGGINNDGVIFNYDPSSAIFNKLLDFNGTGGVGGPMGSLMQAINGKLYGMTFGGGNLTNGEIFSYDPSSSIYNIIFDFQGGANGQQPYGDLIEPSNGLLYGMTSSGGTANSGVLFSLDPTTAIFTKLVDFNDAIVGGHPLSNVIQAGNGKLYGMTNEGGSDNRGVLYSCDPATSVFTKLLDFNWSINGSWPYGNLVQALDGKLYGMTSLGGNFADGVIFNYDPSTGIFRDLFDFDGTLNGSYPMGGLIQADNGKLYGLTASGGSYDAGVLFSYDPSSSSYTKLLDFNGAVNGSSPQGSLIQARNSKLYGQTNAGGINNFGVLFSYDPVTSIYTKLLDFDGVATGSNPQGSLLQADNGMLYGLTNSGGNNLYYGVLFSYNISNSGFSKLIDFNGSGRGANPAGGLIQASTGKLYGITTNGGNNEAGVIFSFDINSNVYINLMDFDGNMGTHPYSGLFELANINTLNVNSSCAGNIVNVPFHTGGKFYNGNIFTAQLSDSGGSFTAPVNIGTLASTTSNTILATIPPTTPAGTRYRIRVVGNTPPAINEDSLMFSNYFTVFPQILSLQITQNGDTLFSSPGFATYQWYDDRTLLAGANNYYYVAAHSGNYSVNVNDSNGCNAGAQVINVIASLHELQPAINYINCHYSFGTLYLEISSSVTSLANIQLTDVFGKDIYHNIKMLKNGDNFIELSGLDISAGIYFINITDSKQAMTRKIFIQ